MTWLRNLLAALAASMARTETDVARAPQLATAKDAPPAPVLVDPLAQEMGEDFA